MKSGRVLLVLVLSGAMRPGLAQADASGERAVRRWLSGMNLRERAAQLVMAPFYGDSPASGTPEWQRFQHLVREVRIGGLVLLNRAQDGAIRSAEPHAAAAFLNRMQRLAKVPLIAAGDFERGASMRVAGAARFPFAMAYGASGDPAATGRLGAAAAREARALGIHWLFVPVADVNNNPANPIINIRSFGEDPEMVARHVRAFIEGARSDPNHRVLTTAKHFPGHGDTSADSHLELAAVTADRERMERVELVPFRAAIAARVDAVMSAHILAPALEAQPIPATLSPAILTGLLRKELGFRGIIATDAMDMRGLAGQFPPAEAAVRALEAGADLLLAPPDPEAAIDGVVEAVRSGRLSARRIEESVTRILEAKARVGLHRRRLVELESVGDAIGRPEDAELAARHAEAALTLVKNDGGLLPLTNPAGACFLLLTENRFGTQGRRMAEELRRRRPEVSLTFLDPALPEAELDAAASRAAACGGVVIAAFAGVASYRGEVGLPGNYNKLVEALLSGGKPVAMISLGSPYLLARFPGVAAYLATFSTTSTSEAAAVKALFGEIEIRGRLPVTIPGAARIGDGIQLPAR